MRWYKKNNLYVWKLWFAWYPVAIKDIAGKLIVWLEFVNRRKVSTTPSYEYRVVQKMD